MSINYSDQKFSNGNPELFKSSSTLSNSHSSQGIPKSHNKHKRSSSSQKSTNYPPVNKELNILNFQTNERDSNKILLLKKLYQARIKNLLTNLQSCLSKITIQNANKVINENFFLEKEKTISDLYEQNSIIQTEYEESKNEMDRLQKVISVLEIDLNKRENELKEATLRNKQLNTDVSKFQVENFELNLKIKNMLCDKEEKTNILIELDNVKKINVSLQDEIKRINSEKENQINLLEQNHQKEIDDIEQRNKSQIEKLNILLKELKKENELKELKIKQIEDNNITLHMQMHQLIEQKKYENQFGILLQAKINSLKGEILSLQKGIREQMQKQREENNNIIINILQRVNEYELSNSRALIENDIKTIYENHIKEQFQLIEKFQKENKNLLNTQEGYLREIKLLTNKKDNLEKNNNFLNYTISKLKSQIEIYKIQKITQKQVTSISDAKKRIKAELMKIKSKYLKQINFLKAQLNDFLFSFSNYLKTKDNLNDDYNKITIIKQLQNKIAELSYKEKENSKLLNQKDNKIHQLQSALSQSIHAISIPSGMKNIKIAKLLDDEVKVFLTKSRNNYSPDKK